MLLLPDTISRCRVSVRRVAPPDIIDAVHRALVDFTGTRMRADDQTMVVLSFEEAS